VSRVNSKFIKKTKQTEKQELLPAEESLVWALFYWAVKKLIACQHHQPASTHIINISKKENLARRRQFRFQS
jgi:hypothetical protein